MHRATFASSPLVSNILVGTIRERGAAMERVAARLWRAFLRINRVLCAASSWVLASALHALSRWVLCHPLRPWGALLASVHPEITYETGAKLSHLLKGYISAAQHETSGRQP